MLHRPPPRQSTASTVRKRRYRRRQHAGILVVRLEVSTDLCDWLATHVQWLEQRRDCYTRTEIADAILRMLHDAMRGSTHGRG
jgi:hypothetical protein